MVNEQTLCKNGRQAILALAQNVVGADNSPPLQAPKLSEGSTYTTLATRPKMVIDIVARNERNDAIMKKVDTYLPNEKEKNKLLSYIIEILDLGMRITLQELEFIFQHASTIYQSKPIMSLNFEYPLDNVKEFNYLYGKSKVLEETIDAKSLKKIEISPDEYAKKTQEILSQDDLEKDSIIDGADLYNQRFQKQCKEFVQLLMQNLQMKITTSDFNLPYDDIETITKFVDFDVYDEIQNGGVILGFFYAYIRNVLIKKPVRETTDKYDIYKDELGDILEKFKVYSENFADNNENLARDFLITAIKYVENLQEFAAQLRVSDEDQKKAIIEVLVNLKDQFESLIKSKYDNIAALESYATIPLALGESEKKGLEEEQRLIEVFEAHKQLDLKQLLTQVGELTSRIIQISDENTDLQSQKEGLLIANDALERQIEDFRILQSALEQQNGALSKTTLEQEKQIDDLQRENTELIEKNQQIKVQEQDSTIEQLQREITELTRKKQELEVQNTRLGASSQTDMAQMMQKLTIKENEKTKYQRMWKESTKSLEKFAETYKSLQGILSRIN